MSALANNVVHIYKRETPRSNISHASIELENKLKRGSQRLAETTEEEVGEGEYLSTEPEMESLSEAIIVASLFAMSNGNSMPQIERCLGWNSKIDNMYIKRKSEDIGLLRALRRGNEGSTLHHHRSLFRPVVADKWDLVHQSRETRPKHAYSARRQSIQAFFCEGTLQLERASRLARHPCKPAVPSSLL